MKFTIPIVEKVSANKIYSGVHWAVRKKIADKYHKIIQEKEELLGMTYTPPQNITMTFYFENRPLDCSNCFFMAKMIEDGMVKAKLLQDDSPMYVESIMILSKADKENPRIEVELV